MGLVEMIAFYKKGKLGEAGPVPPAGMGRKQSPPLPSDHFFPGTGHHACRKI